MPLTGPLAGLGRATFDMILPVSPTHAAPPKLTLLNLLNAFCSFAASWHRGADQASPCSNSAPIRIRAGYGGRAGNALIDPRCPDHYRFTPPRQLSETEQ